MIQASELSELEKEKERLNGKLIDFQARVLKLIEKEKKWKNYMTLVVGSEKALKTKIDDLERRLQEKERQL